MNEAAGLCYVAALARFAAGAMRDKGRINREQINAKMPKRTDYNQPKIVEALRAVGATVQTLHAVGRGCPDLAVGYQGVNYLLEIKNPQQKPSDRRLTPDETEWHANWRGQKAIVETVDEALQVISAT